MDVKDEPVVVEAWSGVAWAAPGSTGMRDLVGAALEPMAEVPTLYRKKVDEEQHPENERYAGQVHVDDMMVTGDQPAQDRVEGADRPVHREDCRALPEPRGRGRVSQAAVPDPARRLEHSEGPGAALQ